MAESELRRRVRQADTAEAIDASLPPAASTPFVLALAEHACHLSLADELGDGELSVGVRAEISHIAPSPVGAELVATPVLVEASHPRFEFSVEVREGDQLVAKVRHSRAIVPRRKIDQLLVREM